jgi:hypothetical protein
MRSGRAPLILPILLVIVGGALLLRNFGLIENVDLLQYWPVLLVLVGLQLLLRSDIGVSWQTQTFGITRGTVEEASLEATSGELDVKIRALRREGRLIAGTYTARSRPDLDVRGEHARLIMQRGHTWPFSLADWEVGLAKDLPWTLLITSHLGELDIDLRGVEVHRADLATGIGDVKVVLSEGVADGVRARSTFGNVTLSVPTEAAAVIRVIAKPFSRVQIDETRFLMLEPGLYATLGYENREALVFAEVSSTFGMVRLQ